MYKYLLLDVDGTLLDFAASEEIAIRNLFEKYNLGVCTDEMLSDYSSINAKYWEILERGEMTKPQILVGRFIEFFEKYGLDVSVAHMFNSDYQVELGTCPVFMEHSKELLNACKGKYRLIGVTNGTKIAQIGKLKSSGLDKILDAIYISEDVGVEKPHIGFFKHVFAKENIYNKSECIILGDSLTSDIQGGINYGIDTCWFNPKHKKNSKSLNVTFEIDDLLKFAQLLK